MRSIKSGDAYWILESGWNPREVEVIRKEGNLCLVRFMDKDGGIRIPISRLFTNQEMQEIIKNQNSEEKKYRSPYDYPH